MITRTHSEAGRTGKPVLAMANNTMTREIGIFLMTPP